MGHSDIRMTIDTYTDLPLETQQKELQKYVLKFDSFKEKRILKWLTLSLFQDSFFKINLS